MVSLAVVVVAILAVLVLVFSDQPATQRVRRLRGQSTDPSSPDQASPALVLRGPPPAAVLQRQLALPSSRPRSAAPAAGTAQRSAPAAKPLTPPTVADRAYDVRLGRDTEITFFGRLRSSAALLVLLAAVGTVVALAIGSVLYLAGLALRHTLR
jgi:hypothetical protein